MITRFQKGYTLTELLIVIAVVAVLSAILFPVFSASSIRAAAKNADKKNTRKIALGVLLYVDDNDDKFPRSGYDCLGHDGTSADDATAFAPGQHNQCGGDGWQDAIGPYVGEKEAFLAPSDFSEVGDGPWGGGTGNDFNTTDGNFSFLYNDLLAHRMPTNANGYADPANQELRANGLSLAEIRTPSECLMLAEGHGGWNKAGAPDDPGAYVASDWTGSTDVQNKWHHEYDITGNFTAFMSTLDYAGDSFIGWDLPFNRNGGNVAFADGHQKFIVYSDVDATPLLCKNLPWTSSVDPQQRRAKRDSCRDPNNPLPGGWTAPNWF